MSIKRTVASICNVDGELLIYSNGCFVETTNGIEVQFSEGLNPGSLYQDCNMNDGYNVGQNMILLPNPGNPNLYDLFHLPFDDTPQGSFFYAVMHSQFDMQANNGNGTTVFKNQTLVSDALHYDGLHAVRHANGRDWWIVAAKEYSNKYYILLLTPLGVEVQVQEIGEATIEETQGQITFSPDGTKLARYNARDDLRIFDFDRCTGTLSNPIFIPMENEADIELLSGMAWSADSRYIYCAENQRMLQFDTWASDIAGSMHVVALVEPPVCPLSGSIGFMELGPDGIIYNRPYNGQNCLHRMVHPERAGTDCDFQQNYYQFDYPFASLPHFPNFRLGPIDGSACDTLGIDNLPLANWRYDRTGGLGVDFTSVSWYEPTAWAWEFGDPSTGANNYSTEKHPSHTFSAPGGYDVCLTVSNTYGSDTKCKTVWVNTVSAQEPGEEVSVKVYPNPTTGELRWEGAEKAVTVRVYNVLGQLQLEQSTTFQQVDLSRLPVGLYSVQFYAEDGALVGVRKVTRVP